MQFVKGAAASIGRCEKNQGSRVAHGNNRTACNTKAEQPKTELYRELLPRLCSAEIELLDHEVLVDQLAGLERKTRSGGNDIIDHGPNRKDDLANVIAGVATNAGRLARVAGAMW